jgi:hypothetical protein
MIVIGRNINERISFVYVIKLEEDSVEEFELELGNILFNFLLICDLIF